MNPLASTSTFVLSRPGISELGRRPIDTSTLSNTLLRTLAGSSFSKVTFTPSGPSVIETTFVRSSTASHIACTRFVEHGDEIAVGARQQPGHHLDHRHLRPECGVDGPELEPDVAAAHHEQRCRDIGQLECAAGIHHARAVQPQAGDDARARSRCEDGVIEAHALHAVAGLHVEGRRIHDRRVALDVAHLPEPPELPGAAGQLARRPGSSTRAARRDRSSARRSGAPRPTRASPRSAASPRAGAPSTGCIRDRRKRRRGWARGR